MTLLTTNIAYAKDSELNPHYSVVIETPEQIKAPAFHFLFSEPLQHTLASYMFTFKA